VKLRQAKKLYKSYCARGVFPSSRRKEYRQTTWREMALRVLRAGEQRRASLAPCLECGKIFACRYCQW
jgi:hypothetical protein